MCANSYIRKMPEIIDKEGIFQWALDTTKYKNANYGVPLMLCADVINSTRQKDKGTANILELDGKVAVPMKPLVSNYYLGYKINMDQTAEKNAKSAAAAMEKMCRMIGGASELPKARVSKNYGIAEFDRGEVDHYVGFTEALRFFHPDDHWYVYPSVCCCGNPSLFGVHSLGEGNRRTDPANRPGMRMSLSVDHAKKMVFL